MSLVHLTLNMCPFFMIFLPTVRELYCLPSMELLYIDFENQEKITRMWEVVEQPELWCGKNEVKKTNTGVSPLSLGLEIKLNP